LKLSREVTIKVFHTLFSNQRSDIITMGQVQDKLSQLGDAITKAATEVSNKFSVFTKQPKIPLSMPLLTDGRNADQLRTQAEMMYNIDTKTCINIGFIGPNNPAKMELINSCRFTSECKPGTAGITSPKNIAVQYMHCDPAYNHLRFWDLGDISAQSSFVDRCLYAFDAIVIVVTEGLRQNDLELIKGDALLNPPTPILICRAEMNQFIDRSFGVEASAKDVIDGKKVQGKVIRDNIKMQMQQSGITCPCTLDSIYLVSSPGMLAARAVNFDGTKYVWDEFDFMGALLERITKRRYQ
jgi:hypothetical protein